jgi:hypothetical protein
MVGMGRAVAVLPMVAGIARRISHLFFSFRPDWAANRVQDLYANVKLDVATFSVVSNTDDSGT